MQNKILRTLLSGCNFQHLKRAGRCVAELLPSSSIPKRILNTFSSISLFQCLKAFPNVKRTTVVGIILN